MFLRTMLKNQKLVFTCIYIFSNSIVNFNIIHRLDSKLTNQINVTFTSVDDTTTLSASTTFRLV